MIKKMLQYPTQTILNEIESNAADAMESGIDIWNLNKRHMNIKYHEHTRSIALMTWDDIDGVAQRDTMTTHLANNYPSKWMEINQFMQIFEKKFECSVKTINIVKLAPNKEVHLHVDGGKFYEAHNRYHFNLCGQYELVAGPDWSLVGPGAVVEFDNTQEHMVKNLSDERIAIIFDALPNA